MQQIFDVSHALVIDPLLLGDPFGAAWMDDACQRIGSASLARLPALSGRTEPGEIEVIYIVSLTAPYGGHSRVVEDLITAQASRRQLVLFTDLYGGSSCQWGLNRMRDLGIPTVQIHGATWLEKLMCLQDVLRTQPQADVFLLNDHQDMLAIAAVQPGLNKQVYYYHHNDHTFSLGLYLNFARHLDPHPMVHYQCKHMLNVQAPEYVPMAVPDRPGRRTAFMEQGFLTTCSSGSAIKFGGAYPYNYFEMLPGILKASRGLHIHLGDLPGEWLARARHGLEQNGIDSRLFVHVPWTPSVWDFMVQHQVDFYIASFPESGGRATVEGMGAAVPQAFHAHMAFPYYTAYPMAYPEALFWREPEELYEYLAHLNPAKLAELSRLSRAHYERYYQNDQLKTFLSAPPGTSLDMPPVGKLEADPFARNIFHKIRHDQQFDTLRQQYESQMKEMEQRHAQELQAIRHQHAQEIEGIRQQVVRLINQGNGVA